MPHDKALEERNHQRANLTRHLHAAAEHLREAREISERFALDLEVPLEITRAIRDVIDVCAHAHQQENPA
jgi:hypothetical protein